MKVTKILKNKYWRSLQWFLLAANHGSSEAQFQLCKSLEVGNGGLQDINMAREWCVKAAENGLLEAQTYLGLWYIYPIHFRI